MVGSGFNVPSQDPITNTLHRWLPMFWLHLCQTGPSVSYIVRPVHGRFRRTPLFRGIPVRKLCRTPGNFTLCPANFVWIGCNAQRSYADQSSDRIALEKCVVSLPRTDGAFVIGASLSEPHLVKSTAALSVYMMVRTSFRKSVHPLLTRRRYLKFLGRA